MVPSLVGAVVLVIGLVVSDASAMLWPAITPVSATYAFPSIRQAAVLLDVPGVDGRILYRLECHNWMYQKDRDFDYSGDFECRLTSKYSVEAYSTLLTEDIDQSRDWQSRARFFASELIGSCGSNPEYGRVRSFRLRGMRIVLELMDIRVGNSADNPTRGGLALKSFGFMVKVEPDWSANSAITERPNATPPAPECEQGYISDPTSVK